MSATRASGLLLHPTSLPGPHGSGDLGPDAHRWIDWLHDAGQRVWQVMPLGPTGYGDSPYQCFSAFAGNPWLISLVRLQEQGLLEADDLAGANELGSDRIDYGATIAFRARALDRAADRFEASADADQRADLDAFVRAHEAWLPDFALFMALKEEHDGAPWNDWPAPLRDRDPDAVRDAGERLVRGVRRHQLRQYWFETQWQAVRAHATERGIELLGDLPIFVAYDSADVWSHRELFHLNERGEPTVVAGVPPDYFSATGQRWGNPLYRWDRMHEQDHAWWCRRLRATLRQVDRVRIDHFRGFEAYWEIPADEPTAERGRWVPGPGQALFDALRRDLLAGNDGELPIVAEDLGVITPEVEALRDRNDLPGMRVLQFAFAGDANDPYLPHRYVANAVVYTGTHDNDTTVGWYRTAPEAERDHVRRYLGRSDADVPWALVRAAQASVADLAVVPLQDALGLDSEARMNVPGRPDGNWSWRFAWRDLPADLAGRLREVASLYGRLGTGGSVDTPYRQSCT
ncbi:MAG: 4-alpha-glucanotransferase [Trueperaceae bacterium]